MATPKQKIIGYAIMCSGSVVLALLLAYAFFLFFGNKQSQPEPVGAIERDKQNEVSESVVIPAPEPMSTFTGKTFDKPKQGTKGISYTLTYPESTMNVQQLNNEDSVIAVSSTTDSIILRTFYNGEEDAHEAAWEAFFGTTLKEYVGPSYRTRPLTLSIPGINGLEHIGENADLVIFHFEKYSGWFFVLDVRAPEKRDALIPVAETLTILQTS